MREYLQALREYEKLCKEKIEYFKARYNSGMKNREIYKDDPEMLKEYPENQIESFKICEEIFIQESEAVRKKINSLENKMTTE